MVTRVKKVIATVAALAALAIGGSALAQAGDSNQPGPPAQATQSQESTVESKAPENSATDPDNVQFEDEQGEGGAGESDAKESQETPNDDGPGGHADEPGNPNADHQFEGKE